MISSQRSSDLVFRNSQFCTPAASAAMPIIAVTLTTAISPHGATASFLNDPISNSPSPAGSSTNMNGTRNAGIVYFHDCSVVLYGSPPVMAAAANGDSAVGGETSDNTA